MKPFKSTSQAYISTSAVDGNHTKGNWGFDGNMKYPANLMLLFMNMSKMIGNDLDRGLHNLKSILERK